jgi:hypothetical protein
MTEIGEQEGAEGNSSEHHHQQLILCRIITEKEMLGEVNPLSPVLFLWLNCREKSR